MTDCKTIDHKIANPQRKRVQRRAGAKHVHQPTPSTRVFHVQHSLHRAAAFPCPPLPPHHPVVHLRPLIRRALHLRSQICRHRGQPPSPPLHLRLARWTSPPPCTASLRFAPTEMAGQIVSATTGAMNPLLGKLATLMGDEYKKLKGVRKQASFLMRELGAMKAALEKLELMEELDPLAKNWRGHVREMSYDMENCIDDFMRSLGDGDAKAGFIKKNIRCFKALGARHRIAHQIEELKTLAVEANDRRMRYKIDDCINSSSRVVAVDPRMAAIYQEAAGLVGIDGPREELVSWLTDTEKKLKVVSIVGFGGLGKTTLAKQVYVEIGGQFD